MVVVTGVAGKQYRAGPNELIVRALKTSAAVRGLLAAFEKTTGMAVHVNPIYGPRAVVEPLCCSPTFCRLVNECAVDRSICNRFLDGLLGRVRNTQRSERRRCFVGMDAVAVPLLVNREHVATLLAGLGFRRVRTPDDFRRAANRLGYWLSPARQSRLQAAYSKVPILSESREDADLLLLEMLAHELSQLISKQLLADRRREPIRIQRAKEFIHIHISGSITLPGVARAVGLCRQQLCKLFKKSTGDTFSHYLARRRVENTKRLLLDPERKIIDIAYAAGFGSLATFNRIFKKYTGESPSQYRAILPKV